MFFLWLFLKMTSLFKVAFTLQRGCLCNNKQETNNHIEPLFRVTIAPKKQHLFNTFFC